MDMFDQLQAGNFGTVYASYKKPSKKNTLCRRLARIRFGTDSMCWKRPRLSRNIDSYEPFEKKKYICIRNKCM
jgi:hypothetical protein